MPYLPHCKQCQKQTNVSSKITRVAIGYRIVAFIYRPSRESSEAGLLASTIRRWTGDDLYQHYHSRATSSDLVDSDDDDYIDLQPSTDKGNSNKTLANYSQQKAFHIVGKLLQTIAASLNKIQRVL